MLQLATTKPQASFRDAMRRLAATVTIISAGKGDQRHGITATAVTSLSMEPASLLVCINQASSLCRLITEADRFCVNILTSEQAALSERFAGRLSPDERFSLGDWRESDDGVPYLPGSQASIFCLNKQRISFGSHAVFIGEAESLQVADAVSPLIYSNGGYARCEPLSPRAQD